MGYETITSRRDFTAALDRTEDSKAIIILDCFTTWCPQCKAVQPKIDELNKEFGDEREVFWYKLNIEEAEDVAGEYGVSAVPTFMLFKDGDMLPEEKISGPHHSKVREMIERNVKS